MRRPMVAGNWKLNGTSASVQALSEEISAGMKSVGNAEVVVCPPFVYLDAVSKQLAGSDVAWGAQNICDEAGPGAFTGEVSASMLIDFSCTHVIIGHSERRALYAESDALVAKKFAVVKDAGLTPIFCVGELLEERESGKTEDVVARQLDAVLNSQQGVAAFDGAVVAYEPVWAIGTGKTASPQQAQDVHAFIRNRIAEHDAAIAGQLRILYGGSVKANNAEELFGMTDIDGGLIGGASLQAKDFLAICQAAG